MKVPTSYIPGYAKARALDPERADNYVAHTDMGDPVADAMMEEIASLSRPEQTVLFQGALLERDPTILGDAPASVRRFVDETNRVPDWVDFDRFTQGIRMFHRNSQLALAAFVGGTLVEGFASNISKSFFITGRMREQGVRRLRQNNRHLIEIFMPDGLRRDGDGWRLSVRIRLVHAQIRRLLRASTEWDEDAWGMPISSAHLGLALAVFSARLLRHMRQLGASYSDEERRSFMAVWRYTGHVMGVPSSILFEDEADALRLFEIGGMCEPEPEMESVAMAHALLNSAPLVIGIDQPAARRGLARYVYRVSRALIGNELADLLKYPADPSFGVLAFFRLQERYRGVLAKLTPWRRQNADFARFASMLEASMLDETGISFRLPDHALSERSGRW